MKRARAGLLLGCLAATAAAARPASAYVRYYTESGAPFFWVQGSLPITAYVRDFDQPGMSDDQVTAAIMDAAAAWSAEQNACTYLTLQPFISDDPAPRATNDAHNSLIFRNHSWCQLAPDGTCEVEYDPSALAFTWDTANKMTGQIYDADIEINLLDYQWADVVDDSSRSDDMDLQNALTHEMGHFIGLDHTCFSALSPNAGSPPLDNTGVPVPDCDVASADVKETTMYPSAMPGDTQKRTLAPDDQAGVCGIYPADHPPPADGTLNGGCSGCAAGGGAPAPWEAACVAVLIAGASRRRRRGA
jgi:hypothetical protein